MDGALNQKIPANNTTVVAQWSQKLSSSSDSNISASPNFNSSSEPESRCVEIVFGKKDMSRSEIEVIAKRVIGTEFIITEHDEGKNTNGTKDTIKFKDVNAAVNFVEA